MKLPSAVFWLDHEKKDGVNFLPAMFISAFAMSGPKDSKPPCAPLSRVDKEKGCFCLVEGEVDWTGGNKRGGSSGRDKEPAKEEMAS